MSADTMSFTRSYAVAPERLWELCTTKDGIESWWGPEGFTVTVNELDLKPGGTMNYTMTATGEEQVAFMSGAGMPLASTIELAIVDVVPNERFAYSTHADFIPGVAPYDTATVLEIAPTASGSALTITVDTMHSAEWTERSRLGEEQQLVKLDALLRT